MNQLSVIVDDYIDVLLRDASIRVGVSPVKTRPTEWVLLMSGEGCTDFERIKKLKIATYVVHHLLNATKLTSSFSEYFEQQMKMPFRKDIVVASKRGKEITIIDLFRKKLVRFKHNFTHLSRNRFKLTISKGENKLGGKGKQLEEVRSHQELLQKRREKRMMKKTNRGRNYFLNCYMPNGSKFVKVMVLAALCALYLSNISASIFCIALEFW